MALYREDIVDIELSSGTIHRSFMARAIGEGDMMANRFGVRIFRDAEPVNIGAGQCQGFFMAPDGTNILISGSDYTGVDGNEAWVQLPQGCYAYEGQFSMAIKLIGEGVTGTMRIVDGVVNNTGATGAVMPTSQVPTSAEIIAAYNDAIAVIDNSVRFDITQSITDAQKETARENIHAVSKEEVDGLKSALCEKDITDEIIYWCRLRGWNDSSFIVNNRRLSMIIPHSYPFEVYLDVNDVSDIINTCRMLYFSSGTASEETFISYQDYIVGETHEVIRIPANTYWCFQLSQDNNAEFDSIDEAQYIKVSYEPLADKNLKKQNAFADAKEVGDAFNKFDAAGMTEIIQSGMELKAWNDTYGFVSNTRRLSYTKPIYSKVPLFLDVNKIDLIAAVALAVFTGPVASVANFDESKWTVTDVREDPKMVIIPANTYCCPILSKANNTEFTGEEASLIQISYYPIVDKTLTAEGEAADAKVVGEVIKSVEDGTYEALPEYYYEDDYIENKHKTIFKNANINSGVSFVFLTDTHLDSNKKKSAELVKGILKKCGITYMIFGGDAGGGPVSGTAEELREKAREDEQNWINYMARMGIEKIYPCRGNHDFTKSNPSDASPRYYISLRQNEVYTGIARLKEEKIMAHPNWNYYYFDNHSQKVRTFILDEYRTSNTGITNPTYFNKDQYDWIIENIQNIHGYSFLFVSHQPFDITIGENDYDADYVPILNLFQAMKNKTRFTYTNAELGIETDIDFSGFDNEFICHLCGHTHRDANAVTNNVLTIATGCDAFYAYDDPSTHRVADSITEQLFDVVSIDTANKTIKTCRIGGGHDREFHYNPVNVTTSTTLTSEMTGTLSWESSDESVATVSGGNVTKVATGACDITATDENGNTETWHVSVA